MTSNLLMITPGPLEIGLILLLVLLLFGGRKIPQLAKDMGSGIREFRKSLSGPSEPEKDESDEEETVVQKPKKKTNKTRKSKA